MQKIRNLRVYYIGALVLTLTATLLRALALTLAFDRHSSYFKTDTPLPVLSGVLLALSVVFILLFPLLLRGRVPTSRAPHGRLGQISHALSALLCFTVFISTCTVRGSVSLPTLLWLVGILSLLAATVYFLSQTPLCPMGGTGEAVFGSLAIVALACMIAVTYFDVAIPMNTPVKVHLHLALLAAMLFLLYELRDAVGAPLPRMRVAFTALLFFLAVTVGASDLIAALTGYARGFLYLSHDLLLLGLGLCAAARGITDLKQTERNTPQL